jgi:short-subunit dehydrogenase
MNKKIAIITGASSGMGRDFVTVLDRDEKFDEISVIARRADRLETLRSVLRAPLRVLPMDLTAADSITHLRELLESDKPNVAVLVNASGYGKFGRHDEISLEETLGMIDLNCRALVAVTEVTLPYMQQGGRIYQLGSLSSFQPVPYLNVYAASKAFVLSYSRGLNVELKPRGIRVMAVCPGWVKTEFFDRAETGEKKTITYFNHIYESADVVKRALRDMKLGRDVSVLGLPIRNQVRLVKMLPHKLIMSVWMKQQGLPR